MSPTTSALASSSVCALTVCCMGSVQILQVWMPYLMPYLMSAVFFSPFWCVCVCVWACAIGVKVCGCMCTCRIGGVCWFSEQSSFDFFGVWGHMGAVLHCCRLCLKQEEDRGTVLHSTMGLYCSQKQPGALVWSTISKIV